MWYVRCIPGLCLKAVGIILCHLVLQLRKQEVVYQVMTRLNQIFYSLSESCESSSFFVICLKLKNTFGVVNELCSQNRTNAYWKQCHRIVLTNLYPIFNPTWKIVTRTITDSFPQASERGNVIHIIWRPSTQTYKPDCRSWLQPLLPANFICLFNSLWLSFLLCKLRITRLFCGLNE